MTAVLVDTTGVTGLKIIRAIVAGERDPHALARLLDRRCKHTAADIATALEGRYRPEHVTELRLCLKMGDAKQKAVAGPRNRQHLGRLGYGHADARELALVGYPHAVAGVLHHDHGPGSAPSIATAARNTADLSVMVPEALCGPATVSNAYSSPAYPILFVYGRQSRSCP